MKKILILLLLQQSFIAHAQLYAPNQAVSAASNPATGNIGIGITNPTEKLEVAGGGRFDGGSCLKQAPFRMIITQRFGIIRLPDMVCIHKAVVVPDMLFIF